MPDAHAMAKIAYDWVVANLDRVAGLSPSARTATFVVAANNATADEKTQADYLCNGAADEIEMQAALDALTAGRTSPQKVLFVGDFACTDQVTVSSYTIIELNGSITRTGATHSRIAWTTSDADEVTIFGGVYVDCNIQTYLGSNVVIDSVLLDQSKIYCNATDGIRISNLVSKPDADLADAVIMITSNVAATASAKITLENIRIECNAAQTATPIQIGQATTFPDTNWVRLNNVYVSNTQSAVADGIDLINVGWALVVNCQVFDCNVGFSLLTKYTSVVNCSAYYNKGSGFVFGDPVVQDQDCFRILFLGNVAANNGQAAGANERDRAGFAVCRTGAFTSHYATFVGNIATTDDGTQDYGIAIDAGGNYATIHDNDLAGSDTAGVWAEGTVTNKSIKNNTGYIVKGEVRSTGFNLTGGAANAIAFAWHNPELQEILIKKVIVSIETAGGTVGSQLDVGIADDATGTNRGTEFFDNIDLNAVAINDSWVAGDGGTQTKWVFCDDTAAAANGWIVGQILTQAAANLVASAYIEYVGK